MNRVQELAFEALRCKQLPFRAKPFAEVLTRAVPGIKGEPVAHAIRKLLAATAQWKTPAGKRVKRELRAMLERGTL